MDDDLTRLTRRLRLTPEERLRPARWRPAADVHRTRRGWLVKLDLAGVDPDALSVEVHHRFLAVRGLRRDSTEGESEACQVLEITYSTFERVFELPVDLESARLYSEYRNGMLLVTVMMEAETR